MKKSIRPFYLNETSENVKRIQEWLTLMGYSIAEGELDSHSFGESTLRAVRAFQQRFNIKCDDRHIVDRIISQSLKEKKNFLVKKIRKKN